MFGRTFYHGTLRKYVILFGTLFNDIWINRTDSNGNVKQSFKIPLSYGPQEKFLARIEGASNERDGIDQEFATVLPRMGFEMTSFNYAAERKLSTIQKHTVSNYSTSNTVRQYQYNPVPYDITFTLSIFVKNTTDGTMIIEQILPYFTPEFTTTVQLVEEPDVTLDIPLVINSISQDDVYEGSFEERRALIWSIDFTMKGVLFGPTRRSSIINLANTNFYDASAFSDIDDAIANTGIVDTIDVTPGLLANGQPTTLNSETTIQATATAQIDAGEITGFTITNVGYGYTQDGTSVTVTATPAPTTDATFDVVVEDNKVVQLILTNPGSGYQTLPQINISAPDLASVAVDQIDAGDNYGIVTDVSGPLIDGEET